MRKLKATGTANTLSKPCWRWKVNNQDKSAIQLFWFSLPCGFSLLSCMVCKEGLHIISRLKITFPTSLNQSQPISTSLNQSEPVWITNSWASTMHSHLAGATSDLAYMATGAGSAWQLASPGEKGGRKGSCWCRTILPKMTSAFFSSHQTAESDRTRTITPRASTPWSCRGSPFRNWRAEITCRSGY